MPDVLTNLYVVEVKCRKKLPQWFKDLVAKAAGDPVYITRQLPKWMQEAVFNAITHATVKQVRFAVFHEKYKRYDYVLMSAGDHREWFGGPGTPMGAYVAMKLCDFKDRYGAVHYKGGKCTS